jgi:hypothetical protein
MRSTQTRQATRYRARNCELKSSAARSTGAQAAQVADATGKGATVLVGGGEVPGKGWYFPPTVLTDVDHSMTVMSHESFGPVVGIQVTCPPSPPSQSRGVYGSESCCRSAKNVTRFSIHASSAA